MVNTTGWEKPQSTKNYGGLSNLLMPPVSTGKGIFSRNTGNQKKGWGLWNIKAPQCGIRSTNRIVLPNIWDKLKDRGADSVRLSELRSISKNDPRWHDPVTVQDARVVSLPPSRSWAGMRIQDAEGSLSNSLVPCGSETQWPPFVLTSVQLQPHVPPAGCCQGTGNKLCSRPLTEGEVSVRCQLLERISEGLTFFSYENEDPDGIRFWHSEDT